MSMRLSTCPLEFKPTPATRFRKKMSEKYDDIERNEAKETIESEEENTMGTLFSLRNILIALGSLVGVAGLGYVMLKATGCEYVSSTAFVNSNLIIYQNGDTTFAVNPLDPELQSKILIKKQLYVDSFQLSKDMKQVFFKGSAGVQVLKLDNLSTVPVPLPDYQHLSFVLMKPELNSILYTSKVGRKILQYNLTAPNEPKEYSTVCNYDYEKPTILGQCGEGSKILYKCGNNANVMLKDLDSSGPDVYLKFVREGSGPLIISPDGTHAITYKNLPAKEWSISNLSKPEEEAKQVHFNINVTPVLSHLFSADGKTLYIILNSATDSSGFELFEIDFEVLLESVKAGEVYQLGPGRKIKSVQ